MNDSKFLFLSLLDTGIVALFSSLRTLLSHRVSSHSIHVTLKGPQPSNFNTAAAFEYLDEEYPLILSGFGIFEFKGNFYVHQKVMISQMDKYKLWYKPSFKGQKTPHITLCETVDKNYAEDVKKFLSLEIKDLMCHKYEFVQSTSSQKDMFMKNNDSVLSEEKSFIDLIQRGQVRKGVLMRARDLRIKGDATL